MDVGINYPWQSCRTYGADFGYIRGWPPSEENPKQREWQAPGKKNEKLTILDETLVWYVTLGINIVRWFILADGISYGIDNKAPHTALDRLTGDCVWTFDPSCDLAEGFALDFERLLLHFQSLNKTLPEQKKIKLLPSLVDYQCFRPVAKESKTPFCGCGHVVVKGGRYAPINAIEVDQTHKFLAHTLDPLLKITKEKPDLKKQIYAWELINEPELVTQTPGDQPDPQKTIPLENMRRFIKEGVKRINEAKFISTVGFAHHTTLTSSEWNLADLGIALPQFHYYGTLDGRNQADLPQNDVNALLGEIATNTKNDHWRELTKSDTVYNRLRSAKAKGYKTVLLWSGRPEEEDLKDPGCTSDKLKGNPRCEGCPANENDPKTKENSKPKEPERQPRTCGDPRTGWLSKNMAVEQQVLQFKQEEQRRSH